MTTTNNRRTQAQRREETRSALLVSACRLFGERGYDNTSLEVIAEHCDLTIRPIYYHFKSKQGLFSAVNDLMEQQAAEALVNASPVEAWQAFMELCEQPVFRQIVLEDAPNVLGRNRWQVADSLPWSRALPGESSREPEDQSRISMSGRVALASFIEAAMAVVEAGDHRRDRAEARELIVHLMNNLKTQEIHPC